MHIGIQLPEIERFVPWPEYRALAMAAEEGGFDSLWLGDHLLYDKPDGSKGPWECWTLLAAIAAVTERPLLGPLVSPTAFRGPALLAKMAGTVDEISDGRLVLGLGSGWNQREFDAFDFPFDKRVTRFEEAFTIITGLIRTGRVDFAGDYYQAPQTELVPPARAELPIMIGSTGPRTLAITAADMNWWNEWWSHFGNAPDGLGPLVDRVDGALRSADRDPAEVIKSVALMVQLPGGAGRLMGAEVEAEAPPITGSSAEIAEQILRFSPLIDHVQLVVDPITMESIEALEPVVARVHRG
jgi:alkanesulfonate monooxygenase SsuD/methylene tetrahydromethanopterin reductase-like flavin-dependent oxidoreductase (luciferase family)